MGRKYVKKFRGLRRTYNELSKEELKKEIKRKLFLVEKLAFMNALTDGKTSSERVMLLHKIGLDPVQISEKIDEYTARPYDKVSVYRVKNYLAAWGLKPNKMR